MAGQPKLAVARKPGHLNGHILNVEVHLSERDWEMLRLIGREKQNKEIAAALDLSLRNTRFLISRLCAKCGVQGRVGLAVVAAKHGLV